MLAFSLTCSAHGLPIYPITQLAIILGDSRLCPVDSVNEDTILQCLFTVRKVGKKLFKLENYQANPREIKILNLQGDTTWDVG